MIITNMEGPIWIDNTIIDEVKFDDLTSSEQYFSLYNYDHNETKLILRIRYNFMTDEYSYFETIDDSDKGRWYKLPNGSILLDTIRLTMLNYPNKLILKHTKIFWLLVRDIIRCRDIMEYLIKMIINNDWLNIGDVMPIYNNRI